MGILGQTNEELAWTYQSAKKAGNFNHAKQVEYILRERFLNIVHGSIKQIFTELSHNLDNQNNPEIIHKLEGLTYNRTIKKWENGAVLDAYSSINNSANYQSHIFRTVSNILDAVCIHVYQNANGSNNIETAEYAWNLLWTKYNDEETCKCINGILWGKDSDYGDLNSTQFVRDVSEAACEIINRKWKQKNIVPETFDTEKYFYPYWKKAVRHAVYSVIKKMKTSFLFGDDSNTCVDNTSNRHHESDTVNTAELSVEEIENYNHQIAERLPFWAKYLLAKAKLEQEIYNLTEKEVRCVRAMAVYKLKNGFYELSRAEESALVICAYYNYNAEMVDKIVEESRKITYSYGLDEKEIKEIAKWIYCNSAGEETQKKLREGQSYYDLSAGEAEQLNSWLIHDQSEDISANEIEANYFPEKDIEEIAKSECTSQPEALKALIQLARLNIIIDQIDHRLEEVSIIANARYKHGKKKIGMTSPEIAYILWDEIYDEIIRKRRKDHIDQVYHRVKDIIDRFIKDELWDL